MRLYFIRHGQSSNNALWDSTGSDSGRSDDPELSSLGLQQARALGEYLQHANDPFEQGRLTFTHLYCSPMTRAVQTALEVSRATGVPAEVWEDWHEAGGIWLERDGLRVGQAGKTRSDFERYFPDLRLPAHYGDTGWWSRDHEQRTALYPRAQRVWAELLGRHGDTSDRVAVVSHGLLYAFVMAVALGLPQLEGVFFVLNNTGLTRLDHRETHFQTTNLIYANRLAHLEPGLVT